jgi:alkylation response protein AidB-like acyl-CoA dehydrogenase
LNVTGMAVLYEEMGRSIFGPVAFNCAAPDDGNMILLSKVARPDQKERWLRPIAEGRVRSAFAMTEPMPGSGSDPTAMRTACRAPRRSMGDQGKEVVHHGRRRSAAFHFDCPNVR